jgi:transposase-like protein
MMDRAIFLEWVSRVDELTEAQRGDCLAILSGRPNAGVAAAAIELAIGADRQCPHCQTPGAEKRGMARGLQRYRCKGCGRSFNALTGTPLSGLRRKEQWLAFGQSLAKGETVDQAAARCGVAHSTAFRWRHRFLKAAKTAGTKLRGIVEADETFVLSSRKGSQDWKRAENGHSVADLPGRSAGSQSAQAGRKSKQTRALARTRSGADRGRS